MNVAANRWSQHGDDAIATAIGEIVDARALPGAATLVSRNGKVVQTECVGWRDIDARLPIERDTLFRIASMSKPITSAAALMLLEERRFALDDPIARWAPEFSEMRVLRSLAGPLDETEPAVRPITLEDLLTHPRRALRRPQMDSSIEKAAGGT